MPDNTIQKTTFAILNDMFLHIIAVAGPRHTTPPNLTIERVGRVGCRGPAQGRALMLMFLAQCITRAINNDSAILILSVIIIMNEKHKQLQKFTFDMARAF